MDILKVSWALVDNYCDEIVGKMGKFKPQVIVAISRGGLVPARLIADRLDLRYVYSIGIELYKGVEKSSAGPKIIQEIESQIIKGKTILIADDVSDSGETLEFVKKHLLGKGAKEVKCTTLHIKPNTKFKSDFYHSVETAWIEYPWEIYELRRILKKKLD